MKNLIVVDFSNSRKVLNIIVVTIGVSIGTLVILQVYWDFTVMLTGGLCDPKTSGILKLNQSFMKKF